MLVKALGISMIVYAASMLCVPEVVIKTAQESLFKLLWKNKADKVKRLVVMQTLYDGGLNFPNILAVVKSLRLSWLGRFLISSNETWQAIPSTYLNKRGGLPFLLKCNYDLTHLEKKLPLFYSEMLEYFKELSSTYVDVYKSEFILWNNKYITIENKSIFWRDLFERGICFVHDLLDENGNFLSLEKVQLKCNVHLKGQYHAIFSNTLKIEKTLFG